jgi:hypothetical protein
MRWGGAIVEQSRVKIDALMPQLATKIIIKRLSGTPLARRSGVLARSVVPIPARYASTTRIVSGVESSSGPAFYGVAQERGVAPHLIMASGARALSFIAHGQRVYARSVMHPGLSRAVGWWSSMEAESEDWIRAELQDALNQAMEEE